MWVTLAASFSAEYSFLLCGAEGLSFKARKIRAKINKEMKSRETVIPLGKSEETARLLNILRKIKEGGPEALRMMNISI
jgi:hypothetical protein